MGDEDCDSPIHLLCPRSFPSCHSPISGPRSIRCPSVSFPLKNLSNSHDISSVRRRHRRGKVRTRLAQFHCLPSHSNVSHECLELARHKCVSISIILKIAIPIRTLWKNFETAIAPVAAAIIPPSTLMETR